MAELTRFPAAVKAELLTLVRVTRTRTGWTRARRMVAGLDGLRAGRLPPRFTNTLSARGMINVRAATFQERALQDRQTS